MNKESLKKCFEKLFTAEILIMIGTLSNIVPSNLWYLIALLALVDAAAYYIPMTSLKELANGSKEFRTAVTFSAAGIAAAAITAITAFFKNGSTLISLKIVAEALNDLCELFIGYFVLTAAMNFFENSKQKKLYGDANLTRTILLGSWAAAQFLQILGGANGVTIVISPLISRIISTALILAGEIKYLFFLKKANSSL